MSGAPQADFINKFLNHRTVQLLSIRPRSRLGIAVWEFDDDYVFAKYASVLPLDDINEYLTIRGQVMAAATSHAGRHRSERWGTPTMGVKLPSQNIRIALILLRPALALQSPIWWMHHQKFLKLF